MVTPFYLVHLFRITSANFVFIKVKFSSSKVDHLSIMIFGFNSGWKDGLPRRFELDPNKLGICRGAHWKINLAQPCIFYIIQS